MLTVARGGPTSRTRLGAWRCVEAHGDAKGTYKTNGGSLSDKIFLFPLYPH